VTEIPEHLLKRSQAAKSKATGEPAPAGDAAAAPAAASSSPVPAATSAAPAKAAKAAPALPPPPKPDPPYIAAAKSRKKIPFWAMLTLSMLPLWVFMYARGLTPKETKVAGPLGEGAALYVAGCSGCHGGNGEGGSGYAFAGGEVVQTFPHIEDMLRWVYAGTQGYQNAGVANYGDPNRPGGPHLTGGQGIMPAQGANYGGGLTEAQILAVVCHERYTLGGADPTAEFLEEYEKWCSPEAPAWTGLEDGSLTFENIADELDDTFPVGVTPLEGRTASAMP
jgi:mono/diheme cytochrome c family protein